MGIGGFRGSEYSSIQNQDVSDEMAPINVQEGNSPEQLYKALKSSVYYNMQKQVANSNGIQTRIIVKTFHLLPIENRETNRINFNMLSPNLTENGTLDLYIERTGFAEIIDDIHMIEYLNPYDVELNFRLLDSNSEDKFDIYIPSNKNKMNSNSVSILIPQSNKIGNLNELFFHQGAVFSPELYKDSDQSSRQMVGLEYEYHIIGRSDAIYDTIRSKYNEKPNTPRSSNTPNILFLHQAGSTKMDILNKIASDYELLHEDDIIYKISKRIEAKVEKDVNKYNSGGIVVNSISSQSNNNLSVLDEDGHRGNFYLVPIIITKVAKKMLKERIEILNMKKFKTVEFSYVNDSTFDKKLHDQLKIRGYTFTSSTHPTEYYSIASPQSLITFTLLIRLVSKEKVGAALKPTFKFIEENNNILDNVEKNIEDEGVTSL
jgi:hypothetical protein